MKIPSIPLWPTQLTSAPRILTVMPPSNQTCNLVITPSNHHDPHHADLLPNHFANTVMNPTTGTEARIRDLLARRVNGQDGPTWREVTCKESGRLMQGWKNVKGTNTLFVIHRRNVPSNKTAAHIHMVADFQPQKPDPHRIRITVGVSKILVDYDIGTPTADPSTAKILINSTLSTRGARWAGFNLMNMYLNTNLKDYENLRVHTSQIPEESMQKYNLQQYVTPVGWVFFKILKGMYGLPQAGVLAHGKTTSVLAPHGYAPEKNTPGLWTHATRPIAFALVVDDFGVKYVWEEHAKHLLNILLKNYEGVHEDWGGTKFCGITLKWDYIQHTCELSMPGYIESILKRFHHPHPIKPELAPHL